MLIVQRYREVLGMHLIITRLPKLSSFPAGVRISVVAIGNA